MIKLLFKKIKKSCHCTALGLLLLPLSASAESYFLRLGTGDVTGVYYPIGGAICLLAADIKVNQKTPMCLPKSTHGSVDNIDRLLDQRLQAAIVQTDVLNTAFKQRPDMPLRVLTSLHKEMLTIVAGKDTDIRTFDDLKGKVVNVGTLNSGNFINVIRLLDSLEVTMGFFKQATYLSPKDAMEALCEGKIDASIYMVGNPNHNISESLSRCQGHLVTLSPTQIQKVTKKYPEYISTTIPANTYIGQSAIVTFGIKAILVANTQMPKQFAYQLTKSLVNNLAALQQSHPAFKSLTQEDMLQSPPQLPRHEGAEQFFAEQQKTQK